MLPAPRRFRLAGHAGAVNACATSPVDAGLLVTGGDDRTARVWRLDRAGAAVCIAVLSGCAESVSAVCFHATIRGVVYAAAGSRLHEFRFDDASGDVGVQAVTPRETMLFSGDEVGCIACTAELVITGDDDGAICFIDPRTRKLLGIGRGTHASVCGTVAAAPPGAPRTVASGGFDHALVIWTPNGSGTSGGGWGAPRVRVTGLASVAGFDCEELEGPALRSSARVRRAALTGRLTAAATAAPSRATVTAAAAAVQTSDADAASAVAAAGELREPPAADQPGPAAPAGRSRFVNPPFVNSVAFEPPAAAVAAAPSTARDVDPATATLVAEGDHLRLAVALGDGQVVLLRIGEGGGVRGAEASQRAIGARAASGRRKPATAAASGASAVLPPVPLVVRVGAWDAHGAAATVVGYMPRPAASRSVGSAAAATSHPCPDASGPGVIDGPPVGPPGNGGSGSGAVAASHAGVAGAGRRPLLLFSAGNDGLVRVWDAEAAMAAAAITDSDGEPAAEVPLGGLGLGSARPPAAAATGVRDAGLVWESARTRAGPNAVCCAAPEGGVALLVAGTAGATLYWWGEGSPATGAERA